MDSNSTNENAANPQNQSPSSAEELAALKKKHDEIGGKYRLTEKELVEQKKRVTELESKLGEMDVLKVENLRIKLAYEAGIPSRLLPLVDGNTEEEIKKRIELVTNEFAAASATSSVDNNAGNQDATNNQKNDGKQIITTSNIPPKHAGSEPDWMTRFLNASLEEREKMKQAVRDGREAPFSQEVAKK